MKEFSNLNRILRGDRERDFRSSLLHPICELIMKTKGGERIISQACAAKFGGYFPLHLSVALEFKEGISTLLEFNADVDVIDAEGHKANLGKFI
jgi:hypothetical protein